MKNHSLLNAVIASLFLTMVFCSSLADSNEDLLNACRQGDLAAAQSALKSGADANTKDTNGNTAICSAFFWPEITQLLIDNGADPNGGNYPAIVSAANNYSPEVMEILLKAGADPNKGAKTDPGAGLRKLIADEKAKGKKANKAMITAWEAAVKNLKPTEVYAVQVVIQQTNCVPCLDLLLNKGAKTDVVADGSLFHTFAAFSMTRDERKEAFAQGRSSMESYGLKVPDWYSSLPEDKNGTPAQMAELLSKSGADVNALNSGGLNPLLTALGTRKVEAAKALIKAGADVNYVPDNNAKDAVSHAAEIGDLELLKALVAKGADVNRETWDLDKETGSFCKGFTPLTRAAIYNNLESAEFLIESGAKIKEGVSGYFSKEARAGLGQKKLLTTLGGRQLYCRYKLKNKMAIYFAIENQNMEMVQLLANSFGWYQNHSMEMKAQTGSLDDASAHKGACLAASGKFTPSRYANTLGYKEIKKYLDSQGK